MLKRFKSFLMFCTFVLICLLTANFRVKANDELSTKVMSYVVTGEKLEELEGAVTVDLPLTLYGNTNRLTVNEGEYAFSFFEEKGYVIANSGLTYPFRVVQDHYFNAYFRNSNDAHIVVVDANLKLIDQFTVEENTLLNEVDFNAYLEKLPAAAPGYERVGWDYDFTQPVSGLVVIRVKYQASSETFTVIYDNGAELNEVEVQYGKTFTVTATPEKDGQEFKYWLLNDQIASYNLTYTFSVYSDVTVEAVYDEEGSNVDVYTLLRQLVLDSEDGKKIFIAQTTTSLEKNKIVEQGLLVLESLEDEVSELTFETEGARRIRALRVSPNGEYAVSVSVNGLNNLYARSYVVVERVDGENASYDVIFSEDIVKVEKELNYLTVQEARNAAENSIVTVKGVITAIHGNNFYLQDNTAAIYVYLPGSAVGFGEHFTPGNEVIITAKRDTYNGLIQLRFVESVEVLQRGVMIPEPIDIVGVDTNVFTENQAKIANIIGLTVKTIPSIGTSGYNVTLTDGTNDIILRVENYIEDFAKVNDLFNTVIKVGQRLDLQGVGIGYYNNPQLTLLSVNNLVLSLSKEALENYLQPILNPGTNVTSNISLITNYFVGSTEYQIIWSSNNENVITNEGIVIRPIDENVTVILTATIPISETDTVVLTYEVVVIAEGEEPESQTFVETFDGISLPTGTNYGSGSYTGVNSVVWTYAGAQDPTNTSAGNFSIDGKGILLRRALDSYIEATFTGGLTYFAFEYRKAYTGGNARNIEVIITSPKLAEPIVRETGNFGSGSGEDTTVYRFVIDDVTILGEFTIKIKLTGSAETNRHVTIDNITWTTYGKLQELTDEDYLNFAEEYVTVKLDWLNNTVISENIDLPLNHPNYEDLRFVWVSSNPDVLTANGIVTRHNEDIEVTLILNVFIPSNNTDVANLTYEFTVTIKGLPQPGQPVTVTAQYTGSTTINMQGGGINNAELINLDPHVFTVTSFSSSSTQIGLNQNGTIRLYGKPNNNILTIKINSGVITNVIIKFAGDVNIALIKADDVELHNATPGKDSLLTFADLNAIEFSIKNDGTDSTQLHINYIEITFIPE